MSAADELRLYLSTVSDTHRNREYRPRSLRSAQEWARLSDAEWRGRSFSDSDPRLAGLLRNNARLILLGEAGSGKSTEARSAIDDAIGLGWIPVFAHLRDYQGSIADCLAVPVPQSVRESGATFLWILDGFDEVEEAQLLALKAELLQFQSGGPAARILLTSRQAFFEGYRQSLDGTWSLFYLLDLSDDDVRALVHAEGISVHDFEAAVSEAGLSDESSNPFALGAMLKTFQKNGRLGTNRSSSVSTLIDVLLETRPTSDPKRQRRALRMLGLAMETAARNVLTDDECSQALQRALGISAAEATALLSELSQSLLVRLTRGYAFQMRSFGEYLAAEDLSEIRERDRILQLIFTEGTRIPSWSWRNAVSYLIERHTGIRTHFSRRFPDWTITSSTNVFEDGEKDAIVLGILDNLAEDGAFLNHHPLIRAHSLARFVTEPMVAQLQTRFRTSAGPDASNSLLLLAARGDRSIADEALRLALDVTQNRHMRTSAFAALGFVGASKMSPSLLAIPPGDGETQASRLEAACALVDGPRLPDLLRALSDTDMFVSGAFYRFRQMSSVADVEMVLGAFEQLGDDGIDSENGKYCDSVWHLAVRLWRAEWAPRIAKLLVRVGNEDSHHGLIDGILKALKTSEAIERAVGEQLVAMILGGADVSRIDLRLYQLVHLEAVKALPATQEAAALRSSLRAFGRYEVSVYLMPADVQPREVPEWKKRQQEQEAAHKSQQDIVQDMSCSAGATLLALARLPDERWPDLPPAKTAALATEVVEKLKACDLRNRIVWNNDTQWTQPSALPHLLRVVERYGLSLSDDTEFVQSVRAWDYQQVAKYHKDRGLSAAALDKIRHMIVDPQQPNGALEGIYGFVRETGMTGSEIVTAAEAIVRSGRPMELRRRALDVLVASAPTSATLTALASALPDELKRAIDTALLERQDKPLIMRRLAALEANTALLTAADTSPFTSESTLDWLGRVTLPEALPALKRLRKRALQMSLPNTAGILTSAIKRVDPSVLADIIREQIPDAPVDWQAVQLVHAIEHERDEALRVAQAAPFERVLQRLRRATTINLFKIWAEGPNDVLAWVALVKQLPGDVSEDIEVQPINGWGSVLAPSWSPAGLATGCHDLHIVFDGDRARDFSQSGHPLRPEIQRVIQKLEDADIPYTILDRYALENYFSQAAYESRLRPGLPFPLDPDRSVTSQLTGYLKTMNADLAARTSLASLGGSDLGALLENIRTRASG